MSELQLDDPDPLPIDSEPIWNSAEFDRVRIDEHEIIAALSNYASEILESSRAIGRQTDRRIVTDKGELSRQIGEGSWAFKFIDTLEGRRRCRSWELGGRSVNWCRDERRYEPADEVLARLEDVFSLQENELTKDSNSEQPVSRLKRILAAFALR